MTNLSENDKKAYAYIRNRIIHDQSTPTLEEINRIIEKSSPRSAILALQRLETAGLITRINRKIRLISESLNSNTSISTVDVPLVGTVAAGIPILAQENVTAIIPVTTALARPGSKYFLLRVSGNSMNMARVGNTHIENNSIILVRQQETADDGQIVVALINDEATVKILERRNGMVILRPKSTESHMPIILTDNCMIQGVVTAVLPPDLY